MPGSFYDGDIEVLDDLPRDHCGIFGVFGNEDAALQTYYALHLQQHRGQESAGIVSASRNRIWVHHGMGIVNDVFNTESLKKLHGRSAIGHVRYSTAGSSTVLNAQPFLRDTPHGQWALAHNGQIANYASLRSSLMQNRGTVLSTGSDSELMIHVLASSRKHSLEDILVDAGRKMSPSFSALILTKKEMVAMRDPCGVRPLVYGEVDGSPAFASESVAFQIPGGKFIKVVERGHAVIVSDSGIKDIEFAPPKQFLGCIFEFFYFSHPCTYLFNIDATVGEVRRELGADIYRQSPVDADIVAGVPDSSIDLAIGYSTSSGIPFGQPLRRSHYIGRTFIMPEQNTRDFAVMKKFYFDDSYIRGKRIILMDDSIVRGTTLKKLVEKLKQHGAKEVHVRIGSPPYLHSCYLGVDTSRQELLVARNKSIPQIRDYLGADSLEYLGFDTLRSNRFLGPFYSKNEFCTYCFDGKMLIPNR